MIPENPYRFEPWVQSQAIGRTFGNGLAVKSESSLLTHNRLHVIDCDILEPVSQLHGPIASLHTYIKTHLLSNE